jgi:hypothetical protein
LRCLNRTDGCGREGAGPPAGRARVVCRATARPSRKRAPSAGAQRPYRERLLVALATVDWALCGCPSAARRHPLPYTAGWTSVQ